MRAGGEGGTTGAPAAVANPVMPAPAPWGLVPTNMPLFAERIRQAISNSRSKKPATWIERRLAWRTGKRFEIDISYGIILKCGHEKVEDFNGTLGRRVRHFTQHHAVFFG